MTVSSIGWRLKQMKTSYLSPTAWLSEASRDGLGNHFWIDTRLLSVKVKCPDPGVDSHDQKPDRGDMEWTTPINVNPVREECGQRAGIWCLRLYRCINNPQLSIGERLDEWPRDHEETTLVFFRSWSRYSSSIYFHAFFDKLSNKLLWLFCLFVFPDEIAFSSIRAPFYRSRKKISASFQF